MTSDHRPSEPKTVLYEEGDNGAINRRQFMKFCGAMAATLALPRRYVERIAEALQTAPRPPLVWLEFQGCTGDTESFLRASRPTVDELLLETISLNYHETLMVPAGEMTERSLSDTIESSPGEYIAIVEGSIPAASDGIYCLIHGRTALSIVQETCSQALATIAVGTCAWDGGLAAAEPNPTGAVGVREAVPGLTNLVALPGCPANAIDLTATLTHFLTFGELPETDEGGRPLFAYGDKIHDECERKVHHDADRYVREWGDEGHRQGWCLEEMGCRGPKARHNCPTGRWNDGANWPIGAGHHCIGCSESHFWDQFAPFYREPDED